MSFNLSCTAQDLNTAVTKANAAAPQSTTYTKAEVNTALAAKADTATTYTKTEIDSMIGSINTVLEEVL